MKRVLYILATSFILACNHPAANTDAMEKRMDSIDKKTADLYTPGFGEFMSSIQAHHVKLWFAGQNQNWKLADFEVHEIMEALDDIKQFQKARKESQSIDLLNPALDSINKSIQQKDLTQFKSSFTLLTNTCNNCHKAVDFGFIQIKIPETSPFPNQDFKPAE